MRRGEKEEEEEEEDKGKEAEEGRIMDRYHQRVQMVSGLVPQVEGMGRG